MKTKRKILLGFSIVAVILFAGAGFRYVQSRPQPFKLVSGGSSGTSGQFGITGGSLVVTAPDPGVFFGTVKMPGADKEFTYLVLFKYDNSTTENPGQNFSASNTIDGRSAETKDAIAMGGKAIEANCRIEFNESRTAVASERLTINGQSMNPTSGRVFLIDLRGEPPSVRQKQVVMPTISSSSESTHDVERLANMIRVDLSGKDQEIAAFLR